MMLERDDLISAGATDTLATAILERMAAWPCELSTAERWQSLTANELANAPFSVHQLLHQTVFAAWPLEQGPAPAWLPGDVERQDSNIGCLLTELGLSDVPAFHAWSVTERETFWQRMAERLGVQFANSANCTLDLANGVEAPRWFPGAALNIVDSCFQADPDAVAVRWGKPDGDLHDVSYQALDELSARVSQGLTDHGFTPGDAIAIDMPMTVLAVAIYLGIVRAGCVVVSISDSFAPDEIATRLKIADAKGIFTQDVIRRGTRELPLYEKVVAADAPTAIVVAADGGSATPSRQGDRAWTDFLPSSSARENVKASPDTWINILFSSGTTGDPKAIPWNQTTPIKCAVDAYLHQDVHPGDVLAWPTNLGWMMGPWLVFAALMNRATIALYDGPPAGVEFGRFVEAAEVTMLGLVPSMVKAWRASACMEGLNWQRVRCFSSTGECSSADDMLYLMHLAGYRPVIEYCGGTEIGGGYLTGTVLQPSAPATFATPAFGLDVCIVDDDGTVGDMGELFIVPPSIGLSTELVNHEHRGVYFDNCPAPEGVGTLRRHGDQMERLGNGYYRSLGRADDTMNLGGIKTSSAEIERTLNRLDGVHETAAIAVPPVGGGPSQLVIYLVPESEGKDCDWKGPCQDMIRRHLNPLFKIVDVQVAEALPRTASNKIMRRLLRRQYQQQQES